MGSAPTTSGSGVRRAREPGEGDDDTIRLCRPITLSYERRPPLDSTRIRRAPEADDCCRSQAVLQAPLLVGIHAGDRSCCWRGPGPFESLLRIEARPVPRSATCHL